MIIKISNLFRLITLLILLIAFIGCNKTVMNDDSSIVLEENSKISNLDDKYGFNNIKLESTPEQLGELVPSKIFLDSDSDDIKYRMKKEEINKIGDADVYYIKYKFYKNRLHQITVLLKLSNQKNIAKSFKEEYGKPSTEYVNNDYAPNDFKQPDYFYRWEGVKTTLELKELGELEFNKKKPDYLEKVVITITSKVIDKQIEESNSRETNRNKDEFKEAF